MRSRARDVRFKRQEMFSGGNIKTAARNKHERMAAQHRHMKEEDDEEEEVHRHKCSKLEQVNKQKQTGREGEGLKRHVRMKGRQDKTENTRK